MASKFALLFSKPGVAFVLSLAIAVAFAKAGHGSGSEYGFFDGPR